MSLTRHLDDPGSPVRKYLAATFPHVRALRLTAAEATACASATATLTGARVPDRRPFPPPVVLSEGVGYPRGTAGAAFDYRLRYLYRAADPDTFAAALGAHMLGAGARLPGGRRLWKQLLEALPPAYAAVRPGTDDKTLARL